MYENFQFLKDKKIKPIIKIRKHSVETLSRRYDAYIRNGMIILLNRFEHWERNKATYRVSLPFMGSDTLIVRCGLNEHYSFNWEEYRERYRYGNREIVESAISMIKRKYGDKLNPKEVKV